MGRSKEIFLELACDYMSMSSPRHDALDGFDQWGYAMGAAFDMAAEAFNRGLPNILDYHPGAGGAIIEDDYNAEILAALSDDELTRLCVFTDKLLDILKRHGKDY